VLDHPFSSMIFPAINQHLWSFMTIYGLSLSHLRHVLFSHRTPFVTSSCKEVLALLDAMQESGVGWDGYWIGTRNWPVDGWTSPEILRHFRKALLWLALTSVLWVGASNMAMIAMKHHRFDRVAHDFSDCWETAHAQDYQPNRWFRCMAQFTLIWY